MKPPAVACLALVLGASVALAVSMSPLRISVQKDQDTDRNTSRRGNTSTSMCSRDVVLEISVQNLQGKPAKDLNVSYTIVGREKNVRALKVMGQGAQQVTIQPLRTAKIRTKPATFESVLTRSSYKACCGARRTSRSQTGLEYHGVGIKVSQGGKIIAAHFEPPSLERDLRGLLASPAMAGSNSGSGR